MLTLGAFRRQPEEYHSAAMQHLESFLGSISEPDQASFGGGLEELQAVLLLAGFALLRPVGKSDFARLIFRLSAASMARITCTGQHVVW